MTLLISSLQKLARSLAVLMAACLVVVGAQAQPMAIPKYIAGEHYQVLSEPIKVVADDKIEVMEIFWYGCGHCKDFEPLIVAWQKSMPDDVAFARTPAVWRKQMRPHAALYYVAKALDLPHEVHIDLFNLLIKNRSLNDQKKFAAVFARYGVSSEDFDKLYKSFGTTSKVNKAEKRLRKNYLSQGTPEVVVNGKYRVSSGKGVSQAGMLEVVNFLIELERSAKPVAALSVSAAG
jgi:thiol:disulfide interchange protein DsbA